MKRGLRRIESLGIAFAMTIAAAGAFPGASANPTPPSEATPTPRIERAIAAREYEASASAGQLQAPNRAHGLRTYFDTSGIRVHDRTNAGQPLLVSLALARWGRGAALRPAGSGVVSSMGARIEIRREGILEWYENGSGGLEQGFTLETRPHGSGELALELGISHASAMLRDGSAMLTSTNGRVLHYGALHVNDATGRLLPARIEIPEPERLRLVIDDAHAAYPVTVDPLLTASPDTRLERDQGGAHLGASVAGAGDVNRDGFDDVIVGVPDFDAGESDEGAAFVFLGSASGLVSTPAAMIQSNQAGAALGCSVAGVGDANGDDFADVVVGADHYDSGESDEGAAFVFYGGSNGIVASGNPANANARLESNQEGAAFGHDVASAGYLSAFSAVIVGAPHFDSGQADEGAAFVFAGGPSGIVANGQPGNATFRIESNQAGAQLGTSVGAWTRVFANGVIVGAPLYDAGESDEGAAFGFVWYGGTTLTPSDAIVTIEANQAGARLGTSVAATASYGVDGYPDVFIGAPGYDAGQLDEGVVIAFGGPYDEWPDPNVDPSNGEIFESNQAGAALGTSLDIAGDVNGDLVADVLVGAPFYDGGEIDEGALFLFHNGNDPFARVTRIESNQAFAELGTSVAMAGDVNGDGFSDVIGGAPLYDAGESDEGAAFVYLGGGLGTPDNVGEVLTAFNVEGPSQPGFRVSPAGDVNGDGYSDFIVGSPEFSEGGQYGEGAAFIYHGGGPYPGNPSAPGFYRASRIQSNQAGAHLGTSVASAGDVNGDGYDDVIVGAPQYSDGQLGEGAAFIFHGSPTGVVAEGHPGNANSRLESDQPAASMGESVSGAGDVNGDGFADVIVGAMLYDSGSEDEGAAFVFHGGPTGLILNGSPLHAKSRLESNQANGRLGAAVAGAGDVNGDGYADVIVGAPSYGQGAEDGVALVFHGGASGVIKAGNPAKASARLRGVQPSSALGSSVAAAGDVNGDGYADVIVGAPRYVTSQELEGAAFVFHGSASGIIPNGDPPTANSRLASNRPYAEFGNSVSGAGDVDGDGFADVIVAAPNFEAPFFLGNAFVFKGSAAGIASNGSPENGGTKVLAHWYLAFDAASAGDVNGDGFADVVIGSKSGDSLVVYGNGGWTGQPVGAQPLRSDTLAGIPAWGSSASLTGFTMKMRTWSAFGERNVKVEVEACGPGVPFGHPSCLHSLTPTWDADTFDNPHILESAVSGLVPGVLYRWRARLLYRPAQYPPAAPEAPAFWRSPWRRHGAQVVEADLRMALDTDQDGILNQLDSDDDGDGLLDVYETHTGVYVSPTDTGSDPLNPDSDGDSVSDGDEVAAGTDPNPSQPAPEVPALGPGGLGLLALALMLAPTLARAPAGRRRDDRGRQR